MKRRTLDLSMSVGGTLLAGLAVALGFLFQANADFATTYGFSVLGEKAELAALVAFFAAAILILASIAGFAHALSTPRNQKI